MTDDPDDGGARPTESRDADPPPQAAADVAPELVFA
jgi:hypothetical protein